MKKYTKVSSRMALYALFAVGSAGSLVAGEHGTETKTENQPTTPLATHTDQEAEAKAAEVAEAAKVAEAEAEAAKVAAAEAEAAKVAAAKAEAVSETSETSPAIDESLSHNRDESTGITMLPAEENNFTLVKISNSDMSKFTNTLSGKGMTVNTTKNEDGSYSLIIEDPITNELTKVKMNEDHANVTNEKGETLVVTASGEVTYTNGKTVTKSTLARMSEGFRSICKSISDFFTKDRGIAKSFIRFDKEKGLNLGDKFRKLTDEEKAEARRTKINNAEARRTKINNIVTHVKSSLAKTSNNFNNLFKPNKANKNTTSESTIADTSATASPEVIATEATKGEFTTGKAVDNGNGTTTIIHTNKASKKQTTFIIDNSTGESKNVSVSDVNIKKGLFGDTITPA